MTTVPLPGAATSGAFLFLTPLTPPNVRISVRPPQTCRTCTRSLPHPRYTPRHRARPAPRGIFFLPVFFLIDRSPRPRHSAVCKRNARPRISSRRRSSPAKTIGGNAGLDAQRTTESPVALTVMRRSTVTPSICTA